MSTTTYSQIKPGQQFRIVGSHDAWVRVDSAADYKIEEPVDLDVLEGDTITFHDHGDADGQFVSVDREDDLVSGILHLGAHAEVERVLPKTGLEFTESACYVFEHVHRTVDGYTLCDSTGTYWA